jgi:predicted ATPase
VGEGQVVLLSGEAGIGKSRLTAALMEPIAGEPHTRLRYFCSPQHSQSYDPVSVVIVTSQSMEAGWLTPKNERRYCEAFHEPGGRRRRKAEGD